MSLALAVVPGKESAFKAVDWLSFCLTTCTVLAGYLFTLAPQVTLGFSGIFSTGAMYPGIPHPPGYPVWTLYAWLFTLLPLSNIACRVALSSAVAASVACGLIALMVSRGGAEMAKTTESFQRLTEKEKSAVRVVAGSVAGMAFGFDSGVWKRAVIADPWSLNLLLLCSVLCLLMGWFHNPARMQCVYSAFFVYGLTFCNSQALLTAAFGLEILVMFGDSKLGREIFLANVIFVLGMFVSVAIGETPFDRVALGRLAPFYSFILMASAVLWLALVIKTRSFFGRCRAALAAGAMFVLGTTPYLYLPLASMTNPPMNWGYPRTVEGFFHVLTRGQYKRIQLTETLAKFTRQIQMYAQITATGFGLPFLFLALVPFCFMCRLEPLQRRWMFGLLAFDLCLVAFLMMLLNLGTDRHSREVCLVFSSVSHVVLALWTGYGVVLLLPTLSSSRQSSVRIISPQLAADHPDQAED